MELWLSWRWMDMCSRMSWILCVTQTITGEPLFCGQPVRRTGDDRSIEVVLYLWELLGRLISECALRISTRIQSRRDLPRFGPTSQTIVNRVDSINNNQGLFTVTLHDQGLFTVTLHDQGLFTVTLHDQGLLTVNLHDQGLLTVTLHDQGLFTVTLHDSLETHRLRSRMPLTKLVTVT